MICRSGRPDDAVTIALFQRLMARETEDVELDVATTERGVRGVFDEPSRGAYFVAEDDGEIVGCLLITYEWSDWRARNVWWIQSVYVAQTHRRRGVYAALYAHVRELVERDPDLGGIRLYVDRRNTSAQQVYSRLGMNGEHYLVYEWMK